MAKKAVGPTKRVATHPGLRKEYLDRYGLGVRAAAADLGISEAVLNAIVRGARDVDGDIARRLARYLGTTSAFWLNLQKAHDRTARKNKRGTR